MFCIADSHFFQPWGDVAQFKSPPRTQFCRIWCDKYIRSMLQNASLFLFLAIARRGVGIAGHFFVIFHDIPLPEGNFSILCSGMVSRVIMAVSLPMMAILYNT
jgi:hypothetical protein